jgi:hypothetical protein
MTLGAGRKVTETNLSSSEWVHRCSVSSLLSVELCFFYFLVIFLVVIADSIRNLCEEKKMLGNLSLVASALLVKWCHFMNLD